MKAVLIKILPIPYEDKSLKKNLIEQINNNLSNYKKFLIKSLKIAFNFFLVY